MENIKKYKNIKNIKNLGSEEVKNTLTIQEVWEFENKIFRDIRENIVYNLLDFNIIDIYKNGETEDLEFITDRADIRHLISEKIGDFLGGNYGLYGLLAAHIAPELLESDELITFWHILDTFLDYEEGAVERLTDKIILYYDLNLELLDY